MLLFIIFVHVQYQHRQYLLHWSFYFQDIVERDFFNHSITER